MAGSGLLRADKTILDINQSPARPLTSRPGSRPTSSRPSSRPAPSSRVGPLEKGDLDEVDQNSPEEEDEEDDDDDDDEQGMQIEGFYTSIRPKSAKYRSSTFKETGKIPIIHRTRMFASGASRYLREGAITPDITAESMSLSDELYGYEDEIIFPISSSYIADERDRLYTRLPYGGTARRAYDPADFEHLPVSSEMKELFQYITRYTPQTIELDHKLRPFIPDFIPAVGDIDAFIKVPRPDNIPDKLGLQVLDEPSAKQSDPTVLDLQLRAISKETTTKVMVVKSLENADKRPKEIESWINSIGNLHRSKPPPTVHYARNMPDIDKLMQEWPAEFEELLKEVGLPSADVDCSLEEYVEILCSILDIPVYRSRVQSLHVLFTLYSEFKNSQHFKTLAMENSQDNSDPLKEQADIQANHLVL